jgi:hypothetical protein
MKFNIDELYKKLSGHFYLHQVNLTATLDPTQFQFVFIFQSEYAKLKCTLNPSFVTQYPGPGPVNRWWPSPAQSFLVSGLVGTHDQILVRSKTVFVFRNGASSSTRGWVGLSVTQ